MADSDRYCLSEDRDTVDLIVWREYGRQDGRLVELVLDANPGLANAGPVLTAGRRVRLPPAPSPATREQVRLWS